MKKIICVIGIAVCALSASAAWEAGRGIANEPAKGNANVAVVPRSSTTEYGWRGSILPIGASFLPWVVPNDESSVYGLRFDFGWGMYKRTYGLEAGLFSASREFIGISASAFGSYSEVATGLQVGAVNIAATARGLHIGVLNYAEYLQGVQIGLLNINRTGITFPIINIGW